LTTSISIAEAWATLPEAERRSLLASLTDTEAARLNYDWSLWQRPDQREPDGQWFVWSLISGRGAGKTRTGAETVKQWVGDKKNPPIRIALVAESAADGRDVMIEGDSGILGVSPPWNMPKYMPSKRRITWPNGSIGIVFSGDKPDQLRGPQFHKAWVDELAKFQYPQECWDNLEMGLRLGDNPQAIVTTTPRPIPIIKDLIADPMNIVTRVSTYANIGNLSSRFINRVVKKYEGTRIGRQELHAELLLDVVGAFWSFQLIEDNRITGADVPALKRIVVAVDPAGEEKNERERARKEEPNETGIVVCGKDYGTGRQAKGYVLADASGIHSPHEWAKRAVMLYKEWGASMIVAEKNQGGQMVKHTIHTVDPNVRVKLVHATDSKEARAEPIAGLMEQGRVKHVGTFAKMEDQMSMMTTDGYIGVGSPDRADAMVWGLSELMLGSFVNTDPEAYEVYRR
jgi:phage terminase large subunit-like protein